jgi:hypothetical protein
MSSDHNANLVQAAAQPHMLIQAEGLGKRYELFDKPADRLKQLVWGRWHNYGRSFWALQDVSFSVARGEVVGLVGRNGAGKSTLLQMVCGTVQPTVGKLTVNGRIAALLELGAGFNPDFSGIENVYLNAALLGLSPRRGGCQAGWHSGVCRHRCVRASAGQNLFERHVCATGVCRGDQPGSGNSGD